MKKIFFRHLCILPALWLCGCAAVPAATETKAPAQSGVPFTAAPLPEPEATESIQTDPTETEERTEPEEITSVSTEAPEVNEDARALIAFAGDTTQSDVFAEATSWRSMEYPFEDVAEIFSSADLSFVNLETSVSTRGESEKPEGYGFRTDPAYLEAYRTAGIDIVSCANNHVRDYGMEALSDTFSHLDSAEISYVGAGKDLDEARKLEIFDLNGIQIGFTACNMINMNPTWYASEEHAGIMCVDFSDCADYLEQISAYSEMCDVLFVSVHWGIEYSNAITEEQENFAHLLCDSGADVILGHHPHVLQPIEAYRGSMIFYSLGNFLFYKMDDNAGKTALFEIEISRQGFVSGRVHPVFISYCKSNLLDEQDEMYSEILQLVRDISEPYGVLIHENGGIEIKE